MADKKEQKETRVAKGAWDVKYKWLFQLDQVQKYLAGLKEKKILGIKCPDCGRIYTPPTPRCGRCMTEPHEWVEVEDKGTLVAYTIGYSSIRGDALKEPSVTGMIKFDGADSWTMGALKDIKPEDVKTGMKVKVKWRDTPKGELGDIEYYVPDE
jgi:uncharacterized OB-fold protein